MTILEEATVIRDKILACAPQVYRNTDIDPWVLAVYCAESYFKTAGDDAPNSETSNAKAIVYYPEIDKDENYAIYVAVGLFRSNVSTHDICKVLGVDMTTLSLWLSKFTYVPSNEYDITLSDINKVIRLGFASNDAEKDILHQIHGNIANPLPLTGDKVTQAEVDALLKSGLAVGDIAAMYGISMFDVLCMSKIRDLRVLDKSAQQNLCILNDWICGKSIQFISYKYDMGVREIASMLSSCGYAAPTIDINIRTVNAAIETAMDSMLKRLTPSIYSQSLPRAPYVTIPPILTEKDISTIEVHNLNKVHPDTLAVYLGVELDRIKDFIIRDAMKFIKGNREYDVKGELITVE